MSTPQTDYIGFWTTMAGWAGLVALAIVLALALIGWLFCGMVVISGLRHKTRTFKRILIALACGPLLLRDSGFRN